MTERSALVTGAAGFIGSHLCERLVAEGWRVRGVDCFTPYYDPEIKRRNLASLSREPRFSLDTSDLRTAKLEPLVRGVEVIWHLAAQAGVRSSWGVAFAEYTSINLNATQRLLEEARAHPPRRFVFASSSSVYGEAPRFPMAEDGPLRPISPYGVSKLAAEMLVRTYATVFGLPTISLRYFTVYGPRQRPDMGFHRFFRAILAGDPVTIFGDGEQTRDFTYIADAVEANLLAAERGEPGEAYNVSGGSRVSVLEAVRQMEAILGRPARREFREAQRGDPRNTGGDGERARSVLGFRPRVGLTEGLTAMAAWMQSYLNGAPE